MVPLVGLEPAPVRSPKSGFGRPRACGPITQLLRLMAAIRPLAP